jgi:threonyl-tRNA synthetase
LIVGEKEAQEGKVSVRVQGEGDKGAMSVEEFAQYINAKVDAEIEANKME